MPNFYMTLLWHYVRTIQLISIENRRKRKRNIEKNVMVQHKCKKSMNDFQ